MKCPKCGNPTIVIDKRWQPIQFTNHGSVDRRRECKKCGYRFITSEQYIRHINRRERTE